MSVEQYSLVAHDWLNLEFIINDLASRVIGQELSPGSSPTWVGATLTGLTATRVLFAGTGGVVSDDAGLVYDSSNGFLGIGRTPTEKLHIARGGNNANLTIETYRAAVGGTSAFMLRHSFNNTVGTLTTTLDTTLLGQFNFQGVDSGGNFDYGAYIRAIQDGDAGVRVPTNLIFATYSATDLNENQLVLYKDGNVGFGTATPNERVEINGNLKFTSATNGLEFYTVGNRFFSPTAGNVVQENTTGFNIYCDTNDNNSPTSALLRVFEGDTYTGGSVRTLLSILKNGNIGFGGVNTPETLIELFHATPTITGHCKTHTDSADARATTFQAFGEQSGGEETTLGKLVFAHDNSADDEKGYLKVFVNTGSDGDSPTQALEIGSDLLATFAGSISVKGFTANLVTKTGAYTLTSSDYTVICNATNGAFTITLPAAASHTGRVYHIKKIDLSANAVTIDGNSSETIDNGLTAVLTVQYESITIQSDGSNWHII